MKLDILKNFIVFEGLDGAGTTTQSKLLVQKIPSSYFTFEPTDSAIGKLIRDILHKKFNVNPVTLTHLFVADRAEHLYGENGIIQRCKNEQIVICDRYFFSTLAYQALSAPFDTIFELNNKFPVPEILFFLNTSVDECMKRVTTRGEKKELFEEASIQNNILSNYLKSFARYEDFGLKTIFLDGNLPIETLLSQELNCLKEAMII